VTGAPSATSSLAGGPAPTVLELRGVTKAFAGPAGPQPVLADLELTVTGGEIVAVVGRSGSGKTTLLTLVAGLEPADAGSLRLLGEDPGTTAIPWSGLAILPQSLALLEELTISENIELPLRLAAVPGALDPGRLMARLGIDHLGDRHPSEVSLGEQQRAALTRAAVVRPRLLLADEPVSHQNHAWAAEVVAVLADLAAAGTACLLATHNTVAFDAADRVLQLREGRLHPLQVGPA